MGISGSDDLSAFTANASNDYDAKWDQGTWRLGADYVANEDLFLYASVATGYKAGGFGDNVDRGDGQFINFEYDPEFNTTYELGFKSVHLDGDLKLLGNVFYSDYEDMQRTLFGFVGYRELDGQAIYTLMTKNVPNSTIQGVELEFDWKPYEAGRLFGWVSMLDTENGASSSAEGTQDGYLCIERALMGVDPCSNDGTIDLSGKNLTWSPELSWNLQFEHNTYTANGFRIMNIISANYTGEMYYNETNYDRSPFHSGRDDLYTVNTSMVFIDEANAWALEFYVHNATDELIKTDSYPANAGFVKAMYAPPMAYGVRFNKDF
jgi:iron complex outermembrane receptor protein